MKTTMRFPEQLRFPERSRRGDGAHTKAIEQLDQARVARNRLTELADAAKGTQTEAETADARDAAQGDVGRGRWPRP